LNKDKELLGIFKQIPSKENIAEGDIIIGKVIMVTNKLAKIEFLDNPENKVFSPAKDGVLFVNNITSGYLDKVQDMIMPGDIVKAKILSKDDFGFTLTINEPELGVIKANCYKCKQPLNLKIEPVRCMNCRTEQPRKIAKIN